MAEIVELHDVKRLAVGSVGPPGQRTFMFQAASDTHGVVVVVEKEQVAMLAAEATQFLDQIAQEYPEESALVDPGAAVLAEPGEPLFRARMIGLGFDPTSKQVLVELREEAPEDADEQTRDDEATGWIARVHATRSQVRTLIATGADAVLAGRSRWN